ncbi:Gfo/Idh/MocA family oxidoreductase [Bacillus timonensis]|nr:Gfo/Idh/MocA family oxidoreductase [Bacillus timonensis]
MSKLRFGILSTANIAQKALIPAMQRSKLVELVAISSGSGKAKEVGEKFNIPKYYDSYHELLNDKEIDAVYIPLPNHLHKEWVFEAARYGKHILCEKPLALTSLDAEEMFAFCKTQNVVLMEAFMYQFHPQHKRVKELISSGEIGTVKQIRSTFSFPLSMEADNIRLNKDIGGGVVYDVGCYCINVSRLITGEEPTEIKATASIHPELNVDTSACGILKFESGILASFDCSFEQPFKEQYEIVGTKGSIQIPFAFRPDRFENGNVPIYVTNENGKREEMVHGDQYLLQVNHFVESIQQGNEPIYNSEKTINNMKVIEEVVQKIRA